MTRLFARWALDRAGAEALLKARDPGIAAWIGGIERDARDAVGLPSGAQ